MRKTLSIILALSILFTNIVLINTVTVSAEEYIVKETIMDDDFNDYLTVSGGSGDTDMVSSGYTKHVYGNYAVLETVDGDQAIKIVKDASIQYNLPTPLTEGLVRISYSGRFSNSGDFHGLEMKGDTGAVDGVITQVHSGKVISTKSAGTTLDRYVLLNGYTADEWYDIEIIADLDNKSYDISLSKDGSKIKALYGIDFTANNGTAVTQIASVAFRSWGNTAYIDDLSIEKVEENIEDKPETGVLPHYDDFEDYSTVSGGSGSTDMVAMGYSLHIYGPKYPMLDTVDGNKVLRFKDGGGANVDSIVYTISDKYAPSSGKVKIAFSACYDEKAKLLGPEFSDKKNDMIMGVQASGGRIVVKDMDTTSDSLTLLKNYTPGEWYDFVLILDLDKDTFDAQISDETGILNQIFDIEMKGLNGMKGIESLKYIDWRNWTTSGGGCIDDLVIETTNEELPKVINTNILDDDFETYSTVTGGAGSSDMESMGYGRPTRSDIWSLLETVDGDKAVRFLKRDGKVDGIHYTITPSLDPAGKLKINYSGKFDANAKIVGPEIKPSNDADGVLLIQAHNGMITTNQLDAQAANYTLLGNYSADKWYDFEIVIDFDNQVYSLKASQDGKTVGTLERLPLFTLKGENLADVKTVSWRNWSADNLGGYIDDLKIEYVPTPPTVSAADIKTTDISGNETTGLSGMISPLTKKMVLDFGTEMNAATLEGAVKITSADGTAVSYTGKLEGKYYIMTFDKVFESEKKYILTIDKKATNVYSIPLERTCEFSFSTGKSESAAGIAGIYKGVNEITALDGLSEGDTITVKTNYANITGDTSSVAWIIAYYNGNKLTFTESIEEKDIPAGQLGIDAPEFTIGDLTDVTEVCVYLWDGIETIKAYCVNQSLVYSGQ